MRQVRIACLDALPVETLEHAVVPVPLALMEEPAGISPVSSNNNSCLDEKRLCPFVTIQKSYINISF